MLRNVADLLCCHFCSRFNLLINPRASVAVGSPSDYLIGELHQISFIAFAGSDSLDWPSKNWRNGD